MWRDGERLGLRTGAGDLVVEPGGAARPGDLVTIARPGAAPEVVERPAGGTEYPGPTSEVVRLPRARLEALALRSRAKAVVREFFAGRGFLEVDAPLRVPSPGLEIQLEAVPAGPGSWLITSPEYQMKRLLAAGLEKIYTLCRAFRDGEVGPQHQPEFTLLEWYRGWAGLEEVLADTEELVAEVALAVRGAPLLAAAACPVPATAAAARGGASPVRGAAGRDPDGRAVREIDVTPPWPRMTVAEAMERWAGVRVRGDEEAETLAERLLAAGVNLGGASEWDNLFYTAFVSRVEPGLAQLDRPLILSDWPAPLAALARRAPGRPEVVERFEAYVAGVELCNAFGGGLTDPAEQRARFEDDLRRRAARGAPVYPLDEKLLAALAEGLPPSAGNALGFDRLVMLLTGARTLREVIWFAADEL